MPKYKEKELKLYNNTRKNECLAKLTAFPMTCKDRATAEKANELQNVLLSSTIGSTYKIFIQIQELEENLEKAETASKNSNFELAKFYFEDSVELAGEINAESFKANATTNKKIDKKISKIEAKYAKELAKVEKKKPEETKKLNELVEKFEQYSNERDAILSKLRRLQPKVNLGNRIVDEQFNTSAVQFKNIETKLNDISVQKKRLEMALGLTDLVKEREEIDTTSVISDEEINDLLVKVNMGNQKNAAAAASINAMDAAYANQNNYQGVNASAYQKNYQGVDTSFMNNVNTPTNNQFNAGFGAPQQQSANPFANNGMGNSNQDKIRELQNKSKQMIKAIEKVENNLLDLEDNLRDLLDERDQATSSERIALDAKINALASEREGYKMQMLSYRQQVDKINTYQNIMTQYVTVEEMDKIAADLDSMLGSLANLDELANKIVESREKANASLRDVIEHKDVIDNAAGIEIDNGATERMKSEWASQTDDHAFDSLKAELNESAGLRQKQRF